MFHIYYIYFLIAFCGSAHGQAYKIPNVKLEVLAQGFRVSIPDEPGVKNVAFNINRNRSFKSFEPGDYSAQIRSPIGGFWIYENTRNRLDFEDTIYIWTNVQYNQLVYRSFSDPILVSQLNVGNNINNNNYNTYGNPYRTTPTTTQSPELDIRTSGYEPKICEASITKMQNKRICKGDLIFEENFDFGLNLTRWQYEVRLPLDMGDAEFVLYDYDIENIQAANGVLTIVPTLWNSDRPGTDLKQGVLDLGTRCTGKQNRLIECKREPDGLVHNILPPIRTARINTKDSFAFKYGRVDIRAKLPRGDWLFPLLLLEPLTNYYGINSAYASGQLRVAFARGNDNLVTKDGLNIDSRTLYGGAILSTMATLREKFLVQTTRNRHFSEDFHVYTLIWSDRKLTLKVDDREYGQIDGGFANSYVGDFAQKNEWKGGEFMAPFDQEFYITLGVAAGGHGDFPDECISNSRRKQWINTSPKAAYRFWRDRSNWKTTWISPELVVDYVRVYAI